MKTNDAPRKIMNEAEKRAEAFYPEGTIIEVRFRPNWVIDTCEILSCFCGTEFRVKSLNTGKVHNFYPGSHPHRIIKKAAA